MESEVSGMTVGNVISKIEKIQRVRKALEDGDVTIDDLRDIKNILMDYEVELLHKIVVE